MVFKAINFGENDCGKKIETSKKRFYWTFSVNGDEHTLELISSFLSGKKKILLDSMQIYSEKKLLNINFEFRHTIEDHSIRITQDKMKFDCYIDNESFQSLIHRNPYEDREDKKLKTFEEIKGEDPFSEFTNAFSKIQKSQNNSDAFNSFGDFDMEYANNAKKETATFTPMIQKQAKQAPEPVVNSGEVQTDFFGFAVKDPEPNNQFFTSQFTTNNNVMFGNSKPMGSDVFFEDQFQKHQIQQQKQKQLKEKGFLGQMQNTFKNLYNQIPTFKNKTSQNNNIDLLN